jgi:hypothetical protein
MLLDVSAEVLGSIPTLIRFLNPLRDTSIDHGIFTEVFLAKAALLSNLHNKIKNLTGRIRIIGVKLHGDYPSLRHFGGVLF